MINRFLDAFVSPVLVGVVVVVKKDGSEIESSQVPKMSTQNLTFSPLLLLTCGYLTKLSLFFAENLNSQSALCVISTRKTTTTASASAKPNN